MQRHELRRLRLQGAGKAGQRRCNHINDDATPHDRTTDRRHACVILANTPQRPAERRIDQNLHKGEDQEQYGQTVEERRLAAEVEREHPEQRRERNTLQSILTAGQAGCLVGNFVKQERPTPSSASAA